MGWALRIRKGGVLSHRIVLQELNQRLEFRRSVASGVNDAVAEIFFDVGSRNLSGARVVCRSIGTACHFPTLANERYLGDAFSGCGVAAGNGFVVQRFFR